MPYCALLYQFRELLLQIAWLDRTGRDRQRSIRHAVSWNWYDKQN